MTDLDLDIYNECKRINIEQEEGEALIYLRTRNGKTSFVYSGFDNDLIDLLISCMKQDEEISYYVLTAIGEYLDDDDLSLN